MSDFDGEWVGLEAELAGLEATLGGLEGVAGAFRHELAGVEGGLKEAGREATGMARSVSASFRRAFDGLVFDGKAVSDALAGIGRSLSGSVLAQAVAPVEGALGDAFGGWAETVIAGLMPFSKAGVLSGGRVSAFARGGVVDGPTRFPMRGGTGLMGEAGPEAILPLARGADGRLGVRAGGGGGTVHVTMNITTPDVAGFERSRGQIAAEMSRALQRGARNL